MNAEFTVVLSYSDGEGYFVDHVSLRVKELEHIQPCYCTACEDAKADTIKRAYEKATRNCAKGNGWTYMEAKNSTDEVAVFRGHCWCMT